MKRRDILRTGIGMSGAVVSGRGLWRCAAALGNEEIKATSPPASGHQAKLARQQARQALTGPIMSLSTPFLHSGEIDYNGVRQIIDFTVEAGSKTVVITYGDSLFSILTDDEVAALTKVVVEHTAGRAMVVAADRSWWTGKVVEFARYARGVGADMLMVLPPDWGRSCTADTFVEHYAAVAREIPVMVVTNLFRNRTLSLSLEVFGRLRDEVDGVYAVKDDVGGDLGRRMGLMVHDRWAVFRSGSQREFIESRLYGCVGHMSTFILFHPQVTHEFWRAIRADDSAAIKKIIEQHDVPFFDLILDSPGGFDAAIHGILELKGLAQRWRRRPYYSLSDLEMEKLSDALKKNGWL